MYWKYSETACFPCQLCEDPLRSSINQEAGPYETKPGYMENVMGDSQPPEVRNFCCLQATLYIVFC